MAERRKGEIESWSRFGAWLYSITNGRPASNEAIVSFTGVGPGDHVLDVGCGPGSAMKHAAAAGARVSGVDPTPGMVSRALEKVPGSEVVQGSVEFLDFEAESFSHVWSISAYHHWAYPKTGIEQILKVLRPGGKVFLAEHKLRGSRTGHGINQSQAADLADLLAAKGFVECEVRPMQAKRKVYLVVAGVKP